MVAVRRLGIDVADARSRLTAGVFLALRTVGFVDRAAGFAFRAAGFVDDVCAVLRRVEPWVGLDAERRGADPDAGRCGRGPGRGRVPVTSAFLDMYYDFPSA